MLSLSNIKYCSKIIHTYYSFIVFVKDKTPKVGKPVNFTEVLFNIVQYSSNIDVKVCVRSNFFLFFLYVQKKKMSKRKCLLTVDKF